MILLVLRPIVQRTIEHWFGRIEERVKIEGVLVEKRYAIASTALKELTELYEELCATLQSLEFSDEEKKRPLSKILEEIHPYYRAKFHVVRSQLEIGNDLLSYYSLAFDELLHADQLRKMVEVDCKSTKPTDCKHRYRTVWRTTADSLNAVLRIAASYEFWDPRNEYSKRAKSWAKADKLNVENYLINEFRRSGKHHVFSLHIEKYGAAGFFKPELPPEVASTPSEFT